MLVGLISFNVLFKNFHSYEDLTIGGEGLRHFKPMIAVYAP